MPKDVLITPASGLIDFKDTSGVSDATIQLDDSGNLNITNSAGVLSIGNTAANLYIGDGTNSVDIIFEQSGKIRALTGKTLTLGQSDSSIAVASPITLSSTLTASGISTFNNTMVLPTGAGSNYIKAGTGDGASFTTYNLKINSWWGIGFGDYQDLATVKAYIDCRTGNIATSNQLVSTVATGTAPLTVSSTTTVSNLSADMLDGLHLNTSGRADVANQVVRTDANGYIQAGWINTTSGDNGTTAISRVYASQDGYIRYYTLANFGAQIAPYISVSAAGGGFWENNITLSTSYSITANKNAMTAGPITIANGVTITIPNGSTWTVV